MLQGGDCYRVVVATGWWLLQGGGCYRVVIATGWWLLQGGDCYRVAVATGWRLLQRSSFLYGVLIVPYHVPGISSVL